RSIGSRPYDRAWQPPRFSQRPHSSKESAVAISRTATKPCASPTERTTSTASPHTHSTPRVPTASGKCRRTCLPADPVADAACRASNRFSVGRQYAIRRRRTPYERSNRLRRSLYVRLLARLYAVIGAPSFEEQRTERGP